jgi:hypothetical protein
VQLKFVRQFLTVAVLILSGCIPGLWYRPGSAVPSPLESVAWGASDPIWSRDGRYLAFSLFGSIWQVPAEGGGARQLTSSPGYHRYPSWPPRGDGIVFVRSTRPPYHRTLNVFQSSWTV